MQARLQEIITGVKNGVEKGLVTQECFPDYNQSDNGNKFLYFLCTLLPKRLKYLYFPDFLRAEADPRSQIRGSDYNWTRKSKVGEIECQKMLRAMTMALLAPHEKHFQEIFFHTSTNPLGQELYSQLVAERPAYLNWLALKKLEPIQQLKFIFFLSVQNIAKTFEYAEFGNELKMDAKGNEYLSYQSIWFRIKRSELDEQVEFIPQLQKDDIGNRLRDYFIQFKIESEPFNLDEKALTVANVPYHQRMLLKVQWEIFLKSLNPKNTNVDVNKKDWLTPLWGEELGKEVHDAVVTFLKYGGLFNINQLFQGEQTRKEFVHVYNKIGEAVDSATRNLIMLASVYAASASTLPNESDPQKRGQARFFNQITRHDLIAELCNLLENYTDPAIIYDAFYRARQKAISSFTTNWPSAIFNPSDPSKSVSQQDIQDAICRLTLLARGDLSNPFNSAEIASADLRTTQLVTALCDTVRMLEDDISHENNSEYRVALFWLIEGLRRMSAKGDDEPTLKIVYFPRLFLQLLRGVEHEDVLEPQNKNEWISRMIPAVLALGRLFQSHLEVPRFNGTREIHMANVLSIFNIKGEHQEKGKLIFYNYYLTLPLEKKMELLSFLFNLDPINLNAFNEYIDNQRIIWVGRTYYVNGIDSRHDADPADLLFPAKSLFNVVEPLSADSGKKQDDALRQSQLDELMKYFLLLGFHGIKALSYQKLSDGYHFGITPVSSSAVCTWKEAADNCDDNLAKFEKNLFQNMELEIEFFNMRGNITGKKLEELLAIVKKEAEKSFNEEIQQKQQAQELQLKRMKLTEGLPGVLFPVPRNVESGQRGAQNASRGQIRRGRP